MAELPRGSVARGLDRDVQARLQIALETSGNWKVKNGSQIIVSSAIPGNLALFLQLYSLFIDLAEHTMAADCDCSAVREEWQQWSSLEEAYIQAGLIIAELSPNSDDALGVCDGFGGAGCHLRRFVAP